MRAGLRPADENDVYFPPMTRLLQTTLTVLLMLIPAFCLAQESSSSSSSSSGSGITLPVDTDVIREDRAFRIRGFVDGQAKGILADTQYRERRALFFKKRAEYRVACRDDIRRANKLTLMKTLLRCYGSELSWLKDFLSKQKEDVTATAGLTPTIRSQVSNRVDLITDAVGTVIFALDNGVYTTKDQLLEAKRNLYQKYELPLADAWALLRADRALTWIAVEIANIDALQTQETAAKASRSVLSDARMCFAIQEASLQPFLKPETADRGQKLIPIFTALQTCVKQMQTIPRILDGSGALLPVK